MNKRIFDFDKEFRFGIDFIDQEHSELIEMFNDIHHLIKEGRKNEACIYLNNELTLYIDRHFFNEEQFMAEIEFPELAEHKIIHQHFKKYFNELKTQLDSFDEQAFREMLNNTVAWIVNHVGNTDRKYFEFYLLKKSRARSIVL